MKKLSILSILGLFLMFFAQSLCAQIPAEEYKPFTGAKLSFTDSIIKVNPECNKKAYYPAYGVSYQQFLNQVQGSPASDGDRTIAQ